MVEVMVWKWWCGMESSRLGRARLEGRILGIEVVAKTLLQQFLLESLGCYQEVYLPPRDDSSNNPERRFTQSHQFPDIIQRNSRHNTTRRNNSLVSRRCSVFLIHACPWTWPWLRFFVCWYRLLLESNTSIVVLGFTCLLLWWTNFLCDMG